MDIADQSQGEGDLSELLDTEIEDLEVVVHLLRARGKVATGDGSLCRLRFQHGQLFCRGDRSFNAARQQRLGALERPLHELRIDVATTGACDLGDGRIGLGEETDEVPRQRQLQLAQGMRDEGRVAADAFPRGRVLVHAATARAR